MPIYEYECKACGHRLEKLQKISAAPLTDCPACTERRCRAWCRLRVPARGWRLVRDRFQVGQQEEPRR
ncbi:FmdB family zinc ribbon protein [Salinicola tamaricis]|uniref:FmdB family zinc ribbon protein n=1 Tax=Salinicola tamaricis TaxID=1771309 RepID=UPI001F5DF201|nr:zinc ribbon domain-containing protein [Salinicola tamaricis]